VNNELKIRLLKDNEIVGYLYIVNGKVYSASLDKPDGYKDWNTNPIDFDAFERGALLGETWVFEGDIIKDPVGGTSREFQVQKTSGGSLYITYSSRDAEITTVYPVYLDPEFFTHESNA